MSLDYDALFLPYTGQGCTIELCRSWLKKEFKLPEDVIHQAIVTIMNEVAEGANYLQGCDCGCGLKNVHSKINHRMRDLAIAIYKEAVGDYQKVINRYETERVEAEFRRISKFNKQYIKMRQKELPLRKRLTFWGAVARFLLWKVW
jgi:hypothetical protein